MTALTRILAQRIAAAGPLSIADYMAECLLHPDHGYYTTREPFGTTGDFTTAPEISQMFGELLGLCLAQAWLDQQAPTPFALAELGPGRGTLMADILRATRGIPGFRDALQLHLVEASGTLRARQKATLAGHHVIWHDEVTTLPDLPLFLIANEFFDALPIRQFLRQGSGWAERQVGWREGRLAFGLAQPAPQPALDHRLADTAEGDMVEHCPGAAPIVTQIAARIARRGGAAIVVDYGDWRSSGDSLQALRRHQRDDPLAHPGEADITAHVDFEALALAAAPSCRVSAMVAQGALLERLGISARTRTLAAGLRGAALQSHLAAHRRLTHPEEMGNLFKAIALGPKGSPLPPGFTE
ncbi:class I SAM-dependent methyltransferase [Plastorhodobacter daqingensis]|uniref:Class I SAM-dependent methyltransferase n=1 Tax=Plastorhodobacter daqingensis TaxID=1387281 RepID=A0ABW2UEZ1_9RHOB